MNLSGEGRISDYLSLGILANIIPTEMVRIMSFYCKNFIVLFLLILISCSKDNSNHISSKLISSPSVSKIFSKSKYNFFNKKKEKFSALKIKLKKIETEIKNLEYQNIKIKKEFEFFNGRDPQNPLNFQNVNYWTCPRCGTRWVITYNHIKPVRTYGCIPNCIMYEKSLLRKRQINILKRLRYLKMLRFTYKKQLLRVTHK